MNLLYNFAAHIAYVVLSVYGLFNQKIRLFIKGRGETFEKLSVIEEKDKVVWIHAASLGEFEQARPIIGEVKNNYPELKIVVTFFSPSGYEIRKNYHVADVVCYLPFDTKGRVKKFLTMTHPELAIIVKYEFWPNLLRQLKREKIKTILVSAIFRKDQAFFKRSGGFMRKALETFDHFFVQDQSSKELLDSIHFKNVTVSGDTRFDRVAKIVGLNNKMDFIEDFKNDRYTVVGGSTWPEGEKLLVNYINNSTDEQFIIAPHNMDRKGILRLKESISKPVILFSDIKKSFDPERQQTRMDGSREHFSKFDVMIVDTIGLLTKIYSYADAAYIGGGFKTGLHNILEAATFGVPVVIGPEYNKFKEAVDLVNLKGCISVNNQQEFSEIFNRFKTDEIFRKTTGKINSDYIQQHKGAIEKIMKYINKQLNT